MKKTVLIFLIFTIVRTGLAQDFKFGKVSKAELEQQFHPLDSTANAAYLFKERKVYYDFNGQQGWTIFTEVHERIKIYSEEGFDYATGNIRLYGSGGVDEKVTSLNAITFRLNNGKIVKEKLSKKQIFKSRESENLLVQKFTMPNIESGAVIEWTYTTSSPYNRYIDEIELQHDIPINKINVDVKIPEYFVFKQNQKGYLPINVVGDFRTRSVNFDYRSSGASRDLRNSTSLTTKSEQGKMTFKEFIFRINQDNISALKEEPYVGNIDNYRSALKFELSKIEFPGSGVEFFTTTWEDVAKKIRLSSYFGEELNKKSYFKKDLDAIRGELTSTSKKIYGALSFVKSKIKWNNNLGKYKDKGVKIAYQEGAGNVADINLTLVNVLRELGVDANPVLVSTRSNGVPFFPTLDGFNYVVVAVEYEGKTILLDASEEYSLPNVLPSRALNWRGTLVRDNGTTEFVDLESSNVSKEEATLNYKITSDGFIEGMSRQKYENLSSINFRRRKALLDKDDLISNIEESNDDIEIINFKLTNKENISKPILTTYTFEKEDGVEIIGDKMYLSPMLFNGLDENPFKIETREYPIDYGSPWRDKTLVTLEIPEGYKIESLPKSLGVGLSDDMGKFVFSIKNIGKNVQISSVIEVNKGVVPANYYRELKEFYKQIVAKQTEKIVLVKI